MKQEITSEKNKELELKSKKSMLNFKNFSLMKKQLFSLVMMLALIVIAGTSAWAQSDGTSTNPYVHANGSSHTLTVLDNANSSFAWTTNAAAADVTLGATNGNTLDIEWSETAAGSFWFDVTETNTAAPAMACQTTVRRVYIFIIDFDVRVYVSDVNGTELTLAGLTACGSGTTAFYGNVGTSPAADAFDNVGGNAGALGTFDPGDASTIRYIGLAITWNTSSLPGASTFTPPTPDEMTFTYDVTTDAGTDFISLAGNAGTTGTVTVPVTATADVFVATLLFDPRWAVNFTTSTNAVDCIISDGGVVVGQERTVNETAPGLTNTTANEIILGAPATSTISTN